MKDDGQTWYTAVFVCQARKPQVMADVVKEEAREVVLFSQDTFRVECRTWSRSKRRPLMSKTSASSTFKPSERIHRKHHRRSLKV